MRLQMILLAMFGCGSNTPPPAPPPTLAAPDAAPPVTSTVADAAAPPPDSGPTLARWSPVAGMDQKTVDLIDEALRWCAGRGVAEADVHGEIVMRREQTIERLEFDATSASKSPELVKCLKSHLEGNHPVLEPGKRYKF